MKRKSSKRDKGNAIEDPYDQAVYFESEIIPQMAAVRAPADEPKRQSEKNTGPIRFTKTCCSTSDR